MLNQISESGSVRASPPNAEPITHMKCRKINIFMEIDTALCGTPGGNLTHDFDKVTCEKCKQIIKNIISS